MDFQSKNVGKGIKTAEGLRQCARELDHDFLGTLDQGMAMVELCKSHRGTLENENEAVIIEGLGAMIGRLVDFACGQKDFIDRALPYVVPEKDDEVQIQKRLDDIFAEEG